MFCTQCGLELQPQDRYCSQCGKETSAVPARANLAPQRLALSKRDKKIAGVCSGIAHYLSVDITLVRIVFIILAFAPPGAGVLGYLIAWLMMPNDEQRATAVEPSAYAR